MSSIQYWSRRGRDGMVIGLNPTTYILITTKVVSSTPVDGKVYMIKYYVIKFVSDLRWVVGFLHH